MALFIEQNKSTYHLTGSFHASQAQEVRTYFLHVLKDKRLVHICLEKLEDIDLASVIMLRNIRNSAQDRGCQISIQLGNNGRILGPFRQLNEPLLVA